jgi:hypothetical protein
MTPFIKFYISFVVVSFRSSYLVLAQDQQVQFNQVINLNGDVRLPTAKATLALSKTPSLLKMLITIYTDAT